MRFATPVSGPVAVSLRAGCGGVLSTGRARRGRRPVVELPADEHEAIVGRGDGELAVRLAALPERQRLVVFLRYFADLGYQEIAAALDIETGTVSATLHAAHANLRAGYEEALA